MKDFKTSIKAVFNHETGNTGVFLVSVNGEIRYRTKAELSSDLGLVPGTNGGQIFIWDTTTSAWIHSIYARISDRNSSVDLTCFSNEPSSTNCIRIITKNAAGAGVYDITNSSNVTERIGFNVNLNDSENAFSIEKTVTGGAYVYKMPKMANNGFIKIDANGLLYTDVSSYALSSHNHSGVYANYIHDHAGIYRNFTDSLSTQTGNYQLEPGDENSTIQMNLTAYARVYIPTNLVAMIPVGARINFIQTGAEAYGILPNTGVTMYSKNSLYQSNGQGSVQTLLKVGVNTWWLYGDLR